MIEFKLLFVFVWPIRIITENKYDYDENKYDLRYAFIVD